MREAVFFSMCLFALLSASVAGAAARAVQGDSIELPFRWTPGQIEIQVSVNGQAPIWCILDTGAEFSILDTELSKMQGLAPTLRRHGREFVEGLTLSIGPVELRGQTVMLMPLDNFRRQHRDIRGVIGYDLFERYLVTIDYQRRRLYLSEPSSFRPKAGSIQFPLTFAGRLPVIRVSLSIADRSFPARLMVDTGASQAAILRHPFAEAHGLFQLSERTTTAESLAGGPTGFVDLPARELRLGRWKFSNPVVKAYRSRSGSGAYTDTDGLLGNDVLRRFRVTFDYSRKRMFLEESQELNAPFRH